MQSAKSGVSQVLGLPTKLICVPKAYIRSCYVLTVILINISESAFRFLGLTRHIIAFCYSSYLYVLLYLKLGINS
jgi:hypothetical protein